MSKLVLLDGASASGKSTFKNALLFDKKMNFDYVRRFTTREKRADDIVNDDYIFISVEEFTALERDDKLIEYRHFLFGMSYGIGEELVTNVLNVGKNALGLMNLGNVVRVKERFPSAICVLIDSPLADIEKRLRERPWHSEEQVAERLENAREVREIAGDYDLVVRNIEGKLDTILSELKADLVKLGVDCQNA